MIAVDTNVVVRFLTRDDAAQFAHAVAVFGADAVYIPDTVWLETEWVLRYAYHYPPEAIARAFRDMLGLPQVCVNDTGRIHQAIDWHSAGLDFADALHLAASQEAETLATFDKTFLRHAATLGRCRVVDPSTLSA